MKTKTDENTAAAGDCNKASRIEIKAGQDLNMLGDFSDTEKVHLDFVTMLLRNVG